MERWIRKVAQPVDADDSIFTLRSGAVCGLQERKGKGTSGYRSQNERKQGGKDRNPKPVGSGPPLPLSPPARVPSTETDVKPIPNLFDGAVENRTPCYTRAGAGGEPRARAPINELARTSTYLRASY